MIIWSQYRLEYDRLSGLMAPAVKAKLASFLPALARHAPYLQTPDALCATAAKLVQHGLGATSKEGTQVLVFYLLGQAAAAVWGKGEWGTLTKEKAEAFLRKKEDQLNTFADLTEMDKLILLDMIQKQTQAYQLLHNIVTSQQWQKTAKSIVAGLKA